MTSLDLKLAEIRALDHILFALADARDDHSSLWSLWRDDKCRLCDYPLPPRGTNRQQILHLHRHVAVVKRIAGTGLYIFWHRAQCYLRRLQLSDAVQTSIGAVKVFDILMGPLWLYALTVPPLYPQFSSGVTKKVIVRAAHDRDWRDALTAASKIPNGVASFMLSQYKDRP